MNGVEVRWREFRATVVIPVNPLDVLMSGSERNGRERATPRSDRVERLGTRPRPSGYHLTRHPELKGLPRREYMRRYAEVRKKRRMEA